MVPIQKPLGMNPSSPMPPTVQTAPSPWPALGVWAITWAGLLLLGGQIGLGNQALWLVLGGAIASRWLSPRAAVLSCALAVLAFDLVFVPPRWTLSVDLHQDALLLATMAVVSSLISASMATQRRLTRIERDAAERADILRGFGEQLRDLDDPREALPTLRALLRRGDAAPVRVCLNGPHASSGPQTDLDLADATPDQIDAPPQVITQGQALGPGTGRWDRLSAWVLPLQGHRKAMGAVWIPRPPDAPEASEERAFLQALCDRMGLALERAQALAQAAQAREAAAMQALRGTLLSAIAHDHRTPLATILGAASSLQDQDDRLDPTHRQQLASTIVEEATQLARVVDNTLQLARLDSPGLVLSLDWQSAEELVGSVVGRQQRRDPARSVQAEVAPGLPLFRGDAVLVVQVLENLLANALRCAPPEAGPIEVRARREAAWLVLEVCDRGPGPPSSDRGAATADGGRTGLGLALCAAIARVHGGEFGLQPQPGGGTVARCALPLSPEQPAPPPAEPA